MFSRMVAYLGRHDDLEDCQATTSSVATGCAGRVHSTWAHSLAQEMIRPVGSPGYAAPEVIAEKPQRYNEKVGSAWPELHLGSSGFSMVSHQWWC